MTVSAYVGALISLLVAGWLRAAGTAVSRVPRADALRDAADGVGGAAVVSDILDEREAIAPAVGVVASALLVIAAAVAVAVATDGASPASAIGLALGIGFVVFLVGDLIPRAIGRARARSFAYRSSGLLRLAVILGGWANDLLPDYDEEDEDEEAEGAEATDNDEQERELIDSVLEFGETIVREVMTPRPDMVTVSLDASVDELITLATQAGYSRIPVVDNGDVAGVVIVRDLLPMLGEGKPPPEISALLRPVEFVPETKLASQLLGEMQEGHNHQMIVVDEYGDVVGLVTIEDLLEELVGEIADETDEDEELFVETSDGEWEVDGRASTEELADLLDMEVPDEEWDTVGGLVLGLAERIPEVGESFSIGGYSITVTRMQGRRVSQVRVSSGEPAESR